MTTKQILLIDDEIEIVSAFADHLRSTYRVFGFQSGLDALEAIDGGLRPEVIISDIRMPELTGIQFIERIRARGLESAVIVVSGFAGREDLVAALNLGIFGFLEKPFGMPQLRKMIERAVAPKQDLTATVSGLYLDAQKLAGVYLERWAQTETLAARTGHPLIKTDADKSDYMLSLQNEHAIKASIKQKTHQLLKLQKERA